MALDPRFVADLQERIKGNPALVIDVVDTFPAELYGQLLEAIGGAPGAALPSTPLEQAMQLDPMYVPRDHLVYLSNRLARAAEDLRAGRSSRIAVSMPPRSGKSTLASTYLPLWLLRQDASRKIGIISHDPTLSTNWGRQIRNLIENHPELGLAIAPDAGAASEWQTTGRGGVTSRSVGQSVVGRGFNIIILDDLVRDFAAAHSEANRRAVWEWWTANAYTRLEPPFIILAVGTRWHEDDVIGRLLSPDYDGDPTEWDVISFPAIAEEADVLGRLPGDPLLSPLIVTETPEKALVRWADTKRAVGSYNWVAQFQGRPSPAEGAVFNMGWWRYWTTNPSLATDDGTVRLIDFDNMIGGTWLSSWDAAFKGSDQSDYVVGQRWVRQGGNRYLVGQTRNRMSFTQTLAEMRRFHDPRVHVHLIEDKANGPAIIDTLRDEIAGLKPINPTNSKEARARAITPEIESGNVYLPHPVQFPWVADLLSELRSFPTGAHDDQVDAMTQALWELRDAGAGMVTNLARREMPNVEAQAGGRTIARAAAARTMRRR
jgi:predicted phage terminase large subunit-like protein